jgi:hypothetical protein
VDVATRLRTLQDTGNGYRDHPWDLRTCGVSRQRARRIGDGIELPQCTTFTNCQCARRGEARVGASRKKLDPAGKPTDPSLFQSDPDYARELTRILLSGVIAEQFRSQEVAEKRTLPLNIGESGANDLEAAKTALAAARLDFSQEETALSGEAEALVRREWDRITRVAVALENGMGHLDVVDAYDVAQVPI